MTDDARIETQNRYLALCREKGWLSDDNIELWPDDDEARIEMARGLFGLALVSNTDSLFLDFKAQIDAETLEADPDIGEAREIAATITEKQKKALLTIADDFLDSVVYTFMLQLDRFDHGFIKLQLQRSDPEECTPIPDSEIDIISDNHNELFQDSLQWKEDFSLGTDIGRREPCRF
ncbi:hypothetical protein [Novipirellula sp.]|uniref:hypothetical protein n=1 Tax=Novipirellula sp. TaxID=2795430 RepID=UPI00356552DA